MSGGLAKFNNRYFQGKGNVEARVTRLEWMAAGMLGVYCDASNGKQAVYTKLYQKPWCILWRSHRN
jgi:hypothetical protein